MDFDLTTDIVLDFLEGGSREDLAQKHNLPLQEVDRRIHDMLGTLKRPWPANPDPRYVTGVFYWWLYATPGKEKGRVPAKFLLEVLGPTEALGQLVGFDLAKAFSQRRGLSPRSIRNYTSQLRKALWDFVRFLQNHPEWTADLRKPPTELKNPTKLKNPKRAQVMCDRYAQGETLLEIAKDYGLTKERVRQLIKLAAGEACTKLRLLPAEAIVGDQFGELILKEVLSHTSGMFECNFCGKLVRKPFRKVFPAYSLVYSCGCVPRPMPDLIDLSDIVFGQWTVIEHSTGRHWRCRCSCGAVKNVLSPNLLYGASLSCGCGGKTGRIDLRDQVFGSWTALAWVVSEQKWACLCLCGALQYLTSSALRKGTWKHLMRGCGCSLALKKLDTQI